MDIDDLIRDLGDPSNDVQLRAEMRLLDIGVPAVERLIEATGDPNPTVRWRAAYCLAKIGDQQGFEPVAALLDDEDGEVAHEARETVGKFGDLRAIPLLARFIWEAEEDEATADHAAFYVAEFGTAAVPAMVEILERGSASAREVAMYVLGEIGDASAWEPLRALTEDPEFRTDALKALAKCGNIFAAEPLIELLHLRLTLGSEDEPDEEEMWYRLGEYDYAVSTGGIEYAIAALGERSVPGLCDLLPKVSAAGRKRIVLLLGRIGHPRAVWTLRGLLNDPEIGRVALLSLGFCGDVRVLPTLLEAVEQNADKDFADGARDAIYGLGEAAVDGLIGILERGCDEAKMRAACVLGEIGSERALEPIARLLSSENSELRGWAKDALRSMAEQGDDALAERCLPLIESLIYDPLKEHWQGAAEIGHSIRKRLGLPDHPEYARIMEVWESRIFWD